MCLGSIGGINRRSAPIRLTARMLPTDTSVSVSMETPPVQISSAAEGSGKA